MISIILALLLFGFTVSTPPAFADNPPNAGFAPLKFLAGEWTGTDAKGQPIRASYRFTSGGTSLTETLSMKSKPAMTTMYNLDGNQLMLTHYCSLNNQPRMRANDYKDGDKSLTFSFVDATNLKNPTDAHMHQVTFEFKDKSHFSQTWMLSKDGKEMPETFKFERVK